jgi:hypothetical protein
MSSMEACGDVRPVHARQRRVLQVALIVIREALTMVRPAR